MTTTTTKAGTPDHRGTVTPEKRLMAAVLNDALDVIMNPGGRNRRKLARETYAWFASDDTAWPFAFRNICAVLGIDPLAVRDLVDRRIHARTPHALAA